MTYPAICDAIRVRHVVRFLYHGGVREVEPYVYGRTHDGEELLRAYQLRGASRSGSSVGWKTFRIDDMTGVAMTFEAFVSRAGYDPADKVITFVNCQI
jgi:WYL domain-containing protein